MSGNENHGTINGATWDEDGVSVDPPPPNDDNYSLSFDGVDDYLADFPILDNFPLSAFCWFKTTSSNTYLMQWNRNSDGGTGYHSPELYIDNGILRARSWSPENGDIDLSSGIEVNDDNWHFGGFTHDDDGTFNFYLDANLVGTANNTNSGREDYLIIGMYNNNSYLLGNIDEVSIWNQALTQEQIQSNMYANLSGNETGLVGYWNFNEGIGTNANDATSNDNDGTIYGATWSTDVPGPVTYYVATDGSDDNDGSEDSPFATIQEGISTASDGDRVLVAAGTYNENINYNGKNIVVKGEDRETTIINGSESGSVVTLNSGESHQAVLEEFTITNGLAYPKGGGIYVSGASPQLKNLLVIENISDPSGQGGSGGGIMVEYSTLTTIEDVLLANNSGIQGGGIFIDHSSTISMTNCTISNNYAESGGGLTMYGSTITLINSIVWGNVTENNQQMNLNGDINITYSDIEGLPSAYEGNGNIDLDPMFVDSENGDFHLMENSPCIDAGDPDSEYDSDGTVTDMGAYFYDQSTPPNDDNYSLSFDGVDDYVDLPSLGVPTSDLTIQIWLKFSGNDTYAFLMGQMGWSSGDLHLDVDNGTYGHTINFSINGGGYNQSNDGVILTGDWHNVAITYSSGNIIFYYDGIEWGNVTNNATPINLDGFHLGNQYNDIRWYSGIMDDVSIWNTALTQDQIQSYMTTSPAGDESGLVGYWDFNEGEGSTLTDLSGNGNNGTINGATWSTDTPDPPPPPPDDDNYSLSFDGADDYVIIENPSNMTIGTMITLEAWIKWSPTTPLHYQSIISKRLNDNDAYVLAISNSGKLVYFSGGQYESEIELNANEWSHVAIVVESNVNINLFINGVNVNTFTGGTIHSNNAPLTFGVNYSAGLSSGNASEWFYGNISQIRISNNKRYESNFSPNTTLSADANTVGYWNFNEGEGSTLTDLSGNGNNGTINGATWSTDVPPLPSLTSITINGTSGYRFLSSPVSGAIYGDLLDELWTQGAAGSDLPESSPNVWIWNNSWNPITDLATDNYTAGSGVLVYVFADTDFDSTDDLPVTLTVDGIQNTSPVTIATNANDWNFLGNPYGLALSVNQLFTDNSAFNSTVYIYDNELTAYKTHNGVTGDLADGLVSPFSGFWIQAGADGNDFEFTEESIVNSYGSAGRTTTDDLTGSAVFTFINGENSSSVYLSFNLQGQINLDPADAHRLLPMEARSHMTSMVHESEKSLSINNLPYDLSTDISMDMDVMMLSPLEGGYTTQEQDVIMEWDLSNIPDGMVFTLLDNTTGQIIDLDGSETANITLPNKGILSLESSGFMGTYPELGESQFTLSIQAATTATDVDPVPDVFALHRAYPNPFNPSTLIGYDLPRDSHVSLEIFDLNGRQVRTLINGFFRAGKHQVAWNADQISSGIYLVRLETGKKVFNQKITYLK